MSDEVAFYEKLEALGEDKSANGMPVIKLIKRLLMEARENGREHCRFGNWPKHLQEQACRELGEAP